MLLRVLPALYEKQPQPINARLRELVAPMAQLDPAEQLHLLRLLHTVARNRELGVNHAGNISLLNAAPPFEGFVFHRLGEGGIPQRAGQCLPTLIPCKFFNPIPSFPPSHKENRTMALLDQKDWVKPFVSNVFGSSSVS